ncbi:MAG: chloride channel protein [Chloroflexi bacterium]|nr:chloride channel protein [Chloroflexota bacterium]
MNSTSPRNAARSFLDAAGHTLFVSENTRLFALALIVGLATGAGVWLFRQGIDLAHRVFQEGLAQEILGPVLGGFGIVVTLVGVGLLVGWIMDRFIGEERHHGVAGIMESVAYSGGRLRYWHMPFKALASALSIGGGASVGPEDPSVQIGANLGSFFGQRLHLTQENIRLMVAAGGASAIAAAFHAPIAGVFFAMEVILNGELQTRSFGLVVIAAVVSTAFTQAVEVGGAEFGDLRYSLGSLVETPLYAVLGLLIAPVAALFIRTVYWQHDLWHRLHVRLPRPARAALAGALVGLVAIFLPQIMGTGREVMSDVLNSSEAEYTILFLVLLGAAKLLMTTVSIAGGFVGGLFAPSLFVGTMLGGASGRLVHLLMPGANVSDTEAFAIAGMAAAMAGVIRAPITAIMMVFELTDDYRLILPIMLSAVVCMFVTERLAPLGVYAYGLARKGVFIKQGRDIDVLSDLTVLDAMMTPPPCIHQDRPLVDVRDTLREAGVHGLCVVDGDGMLTGIVTLTDLQAAYEAVGGDGAGGDGETVRVVREIAVRDVATALPDEPLWTAVRRMGQRDVGRLPVLESASSRRPIGILRRSDVMRAYNRAITRRIEEQHTEEQLRLHTLTGAHVVELMVRPGAPIAGKIVKMVKWPAESSLAAIRRGEKLLVPHGTTEIKLWDTLTVVTNPEEEEALERLTGQPRQGT